MIVALAFVPLVLTLFPGPLQRALHGYEEFLQTCAAALYGLGTVLPPLGALVLAVTAAATAFSAMRLVTLLTRTRALVAARRLVGAPPALADAAASLGMGDRVRCFAGDRPAAFTAGLLSPRVWISTAGVARLDREELVAVLAHECHHVATRDPLRVLVARCLAALLAPFPIVDALRSRFEVAKELEADRAALRVTTTQAVAGALWKLGDAAPMSCERAAVGAWSLSALRIDQLSEAGCDLLPPVGRRAGMLTGLALAALVVVTLGQALRANVVPAAALEAVFGTTGSVHECPLPLDGILF